MNKMIIALLLLSSGLKLKAQSASIDSTTSKRNIQFKYKSLIIPTALIGWSCWSYQPSFKRHQYQYKK